MGWLAFESISNDTPVHVRQVVNVLAASFLHYIQQANTRGVYGLTQDNVCGHL
jgi:hypothetical protein